VLSLQQSLRRKIRSGVYQVADNEALSTNEVVEIIANSLAKKAKLWRIPVKLIELAAKIGDRLHLPLNTERLTKLTESYVVSNAKLLTELQITLPLNSRDGLQLTADSFQEG
jgi:nucleoside-diphosphate-sugar epimerase